MIIFILGLTFLDFNKYYYSFTLNFIITYTSSHSAERTLVFFKYILVRVLPITIFTQRFCSTRIKIRQKEPLRPV